MVRLTKAAINSALYRVSGYHLNRGAPGAAKPEPQKTQANDRNRAAFPADYEDDAREIIRAVRPYTMTGPDKLYALISAVKYIVRYDIPGDIVECGVWRGGSMQAAARTLTACGDQSRSLYLFDTYAGMPPPGPHDVRHDDTSAAELLAAKDKSSAVWAYATLDDVKAGFATVPYPSEKVHYVVGRVEDTVPAQAPETIAILRLDTDWYESTAHEFTHLWDRLSHGGVLMIDDYGHWKGSRRATDEFLERTGAPLLLIRTNSGRVAVKP